MSSLVTFLMLLTILVAQGKNDCEAGYKISPTGDGCCEVERPYCCCDAPKCLNVDMICRYNATYVVLEHWELPQEPVIREGVPVEPIVEVIEHWSEPQKPVIHHGVPVEPIVEVIEHWSKPVTYLSGEIVDPIWQD